MRLILILLGMLLSQPVWAEWTKEGRGAIGSKTEMTVYVDYESIRKTDSGRKMWVLYDYKFPQPYEPAFQSTKQLFEFDCTGERFRNLSSMNFSKEMGSGTPSALLSGQWNYPSPESVAATLLKIACNAPIPK